MGPGSITISGGDSLPEVGDGATIVMWSDRHAATVVRVGTAGGRPFVTVQRDRSVRVDDNGMSDPQTYRYEADPAGEISRFSRRDGGRWVAVGSKRGPTLRLGVRESYHDFSF